MPNWCYNHLALTKKEFVKNKHLFTKEKDGETLIDFRILIPHSASVKADLYYDGLDFNTNARGLLTNGSLLKETGSSFKVVSFDTLTDTFFDNMLGERQILLKNTGWTEKDGWYDWQCDHWGTKWNGGSADIDEDIDDLEDDDIVNIHFQTAWACPEPFFHELAKHCEFDCDGEEECRSFTYEGYVEDGELCISYDEDPEPLEEDEDEE